MAKKSSKASSLSWRTLMRKASKAASPAEAKRLRTRAAEQRRAERATRKAKLHPETKLAIMKGQLDLSKPLRNDLEVSQLAGLEAELARRDQQLVDEFIEIAGMIRSGRGFTPAPQGSIVVGNSTIDALLRTLSRK